MSAYQVPQIPVFVRPVPDLDSLALSVFYLQFPTLVEEWRASPTFGKVALENELRVLETFHALKTEKPYDWMTPEDAQIRARLCEQYGV